MIFGMTYYQICMYFLIYSFLGWCVEVIYHALTQGKIVNRGFLNGPVCPVYGFGMLGICVLIYFLPKDAGTGEASVLGVFFGGMILCTAVEFIAGFLLYHIFHTRWWDYSRLPLNIGGYICPLFSVLWGIACVLVVRFVHPLVQQASASSQTVIPPKYGWPVMLVLYIIYFVDLVATVLTVSGMNKKLAELDSLDRSLRIVSNNLSEAIGGTTIKASESVGEARVQGALAKAEIRDNAAEKIEQYRAATAEFREESHEKMREVRAGLEQMTDSGKAAVSQAAGDAKEAYAQMTDGAKQAYAQKKAEFEERRSQLVMDLAGHKVFGTGRLLRAFPGMKSRDYNEMLEKIRQYLKDRENSRKGGSGNPKEK